MTTTDKMTINKHKSKQQVITFFININKHNQYFHSVTCNIDHCLITQKTIKQPQAQIKNLISNWFLTKILVTRTTCCSSRFILAAWFQNQMQNEVFRVSRACEEKIQGFVFLIRVMFWFLIKWCFSNVWGWDRYRRANGLNIKWAKC